MNKQALLSNISFIKECGLYYTDTEIENYRTFLYWKKHGNDVPTKYNSKEELLEDVTFIKDCQLDYTTEKQELLGLYNLWYETSPDSFKCERIESETLDAANTLVKISKGTGRSNQLEGTHTEYVMVTPNRTYNLRPRKK